MPRPAKNLKLEERIEVARRFTAGESAKELAAAFGISARHVNRLAKEEAGEGLAVRDALRREETSGKLQAQWGGPL